MVAKQILAISQQNYLDQYINIVIIIIIFFLFDCVLISLSTGTLLTRTIR